MPNFVSTAYNININLTKLTPLAEGFQDGYCSGEIGRVGTDKSADPLSSRDRNLG